MKQLINKIWPSRTRKENPQNPLRDSIFIATSVVLILFSGYIVEWFELSVDEMWVLMLDLYRVAFLLIILTIPTKFKRVVVALIINHFIDEWMGVDGWSLSDTITTIYIGIITLKSW